MTQSLSEDEAEFAQLGHAVHGAGQAAEPSRNNSASAFNFLAGLPISVETARLSHMRPAYLTNAVQSKAAENTHLCFRCQNDRMANNRKMAKSCCGVFSAWLKANSPGPGMMAPNG